MTASHAADTVDRSYTIDGVDVSLRCFRTGPGQLVSHLIMGGETYPALPLPPGAADDPVIVDLGANIGAASVWFAVSYPGARIHAVEPFPGCIGLLQQNLAPWPEASVHPIGLGAADSQAQLYVGTEDPVTGSLTRSSLTSDTSVEVEIRGVGGWLTEHDIDRIDVLKVDTEGSELPILRGLSAAPDDLLAGVSIIHIEFHSEADRRAIDDLLQPTHSLHRGSIHDHHRGELTYLSRRYLAWRGDADEQRI